MFLRVNPGGGIPSLDYNAMNAYYAQHQLHQNASNEATPTPSYMVPITPTNPIGTSSGGSIPITVNALNPSARGVADGIVQGLRQIGVKVA